MDRRSFLRVTAGSAALANLVVTRTFSKIYAMAERHIRVGRDMGVGQRWNRLSMGTVDEMAYFLEQFRQVNRS